MYFFGWLFPALDNVFFSVFGVGQEFIIVYGEKELGEEHQHKFLECPCWFGFPMGYVYK